MAKTDIDNEGRADEQQHIADRKPTRDVAAARSDDVGSA